jgi:hypothetical protein
VQLPCDSAETQVWEQLLHIRALVEQLLRDGAARQATAYARVSQLLAAVETILEDMAASAPESAPANESLTVSSA